MAQKLEPWLVIYERETARVVASEQAARDEQIRTARASDGSLECLVFPLAAVIEALAEVYSQ